MNNITLHKYVWMSLFIVSLMPVQVAASPVYEFQRSTPSIFAHPHDLVLDHFEKYLYVADVQNDVIQVLNPDSLAVVGKLGVDELDSPHDVCFDTDGRLLVADSGNDRVVIYEVNAAKATLISQLSEGMSSPEGVTSADNGDIFVANAGNHTIQHFSQGKLIKEIGGYGGGKDEFIRPHDIELGADNLLYIADPGNNRIQVYSKELIFIKSVVHREKPFSEPKYLALNRKNRLYIADQNNNAIRVFDRQHRQLASFKQAGQHNLNHIEGIEVVKDRLWIADTYNNRIVMFRIDQ